MPDFEETLTEAYWGFDLKGIKECLRKGAYINTLVHSSGWTPLIIACCRDNLDGSRSLQCATYLLKHGASTESTCKNGQNPIYFAMIYNNIPVIEQLSKYGANLEKGSGTFSRPIFHAIHGANLHVVELLLKHGARLNTTSSIGDSPIHLAIYHWSISTTVASCLNSVKAICITSEKQPVATTVSDDIPNPEIKLEVVELLLSYGASVDGSPETTPLGSIVYRRDLETARALLVRDANPNGEWCYQVPLEMAIHPETSCHVEAVRLLLECGANIEGICCPKLSESRRQWPHYFSALYKETRKQISDLGFDARDKRNGVGWVGG